MERRKKLAPIRMQIRIPKMESSFDKSSFSVSIPKEWVLNNFKEVSEVYDKYHPLVKFNKDAKDKWETINHDSFYLNYILHGYLLLGIAPEKGICSSKPTKVPSDEIEEIKNSIDLIQDINQKAELLYNWLIAKFIAGYDTISFTSLRQSRNFLEKCTDPFTRLGFGSQFRNESDYGLTFSNTSDSIRDLFDKIMIELREINDNVTKLLLSYNSSSDIASLKEYYENELKQRDKQVEVIMWAVIRKGCRQLDFCESREELAHCIFYTVLAADAKLLERYKDNYIDIADIILEFRIPGDYCSKIADITNRTYSLLAAAVTVLLDSAYSDTGRGKDSRQHILKEVYRINNECSKIDQQIDREEEIVLQTLMKQKNLQVTQIWGYSRIFDRLHRHNKRIMNIAQSAMFGLPSVESN